MSLESTDTDNAEGLNVSVASSKATSLLDQVGHMVSFPFRWFRSHGREGVIRVVKHPYYWLRYLPARRRYARVLAPAFEENAAFDRMHGTDTATRAALINLDVPTSSWTHGTNYGAMTESLFSKSMSALSLTDVGEYSFVDLGSGKGKVLLLATSLPFREIIGVEFARDLVEIAEQNKAVYLARNTDVACSRLSNVCQDAGSFEFPKTPLVVYLYNPFDDTIMSRVVETLEQTHQDEPRDIWVVYANARFADVFRRSTTFRVVVEDPEYQVFRAI